MQFLIFGKRDCIVCSKAKSILTAVGVEFAFVSIDPADYADLGDPMLLTALSDFSWHDGDPDHLPLVVHVNDHLKMLHSWTGREIAKPGESWLAEMRKYVEPPVVVYDEPPESPIGGK